MNMYKSLLIGRLTCKSDYKPVGIAMISSFYKVTYKEATNYNCAMCMWKPQELSSDEKYLCIMKKCMYNVVINKNMNNMSFLIIS